MPHLCAKIKAQVLCKIGEQCVCVNACTQSSLFFDPQPVTLHSIAGYSRYRIRYRRPQDYYSRIRIVSSTATQYTVRSLQFGSSYNFSIRAEIRLSRYCYSYLYGDYSDPVDATTRETGIFTYVAVPGRNRTLFRCVFRSHCFVRSALAWSFR